MTKIATPTTPEQAELSKQLAITEIRAKIADANARITDAQARQREAHLRLKIAEKDLAALN